MRSVPLLYKRLFGEELDFFNMLELAAYVLRQCGGIATESYLTIGKIENHRLKLPCPIYAVKSVTTATNHFDYLRFQGLYPHNLLINYNLPDVLRAPEVEEASDRFTEAEHGNAGPGVPEKYFVNKVKGHFVDFHNENNHCLFFPHAQGEVEVVFTTTDLDDEGYPTISESLQMAIAYYCYFVKQQQRFFRREIDGNMFSWIDQEKGRKIAQARSPLAVSDNELDDMLEMMLSHNRKTLRTPYLPSR